MRAHVYLAPLFLLSTAALAGPNEAALRDAFEGSYVTVKIDMPATKDGVDLYPHSDRPLDLKRYSSRIKASGTSLKKGDSVMVTLVKVKEKNIEFQLGGGGFGTVGDDSGDIFIPTSSSKTKREKDLEEERKTVTDKEKKKSIDRELRDLRNERSREDARLRAESAQAEEARQTRVRLQARDSGSRFNLWFPSGVPSEILTAQGIRQALADYVEFSDAADSDGAVAIDPGSGADSLPGFQPAGLRKGMTFEEVAGTLGEPESCMERAEGALTVTTCQYQMTEARAEGQFVDGVLLRYTITSQ